MTASMHAHAIVGSDDLWLQHAAMRWYGDGATNTMSMTHCFLATPGVLFLATTGVLNHWAPGSAAKE